MLQTWRSRPIPPVAHLIIDARYEKVRVAEIVCSRAVSSAIGIRSGDGKRTILGVSVSLLEAEVPWRDFLSDLKVRGLAPTGSISSDVHEGLEAALAAVFPLFRGTGASSISRRTLRLTFRGRTSKKP